MLSMTKATSHCTPRCRTSFNKAYHDASWSSSWGLLTPCQQEVSRVSAFNPAHLPGRTQDANYVSFQLQSHAPRARAMMRSTYIRPGPSCPTSRTPHHGECLLAGQWTRSLGPWWPGRRWSAVAHDTVKKQQAVAGSGLDAAGGVVAAA